MDGTRGGRAGGGGGEGGRVEGGKGGETGGYELPTSAFFKQAPKTLISNLIFLSS